MLLKNVAGQGVYLFAWDPAANAGAGGPKAGDAANITGKVSKDGAAEASFGTANPTEIGGGLYWQPLALAETNANALAFRWSSSTSGIQIDPVEVFTSGANLPPVAYDAAGGLPTTSYYTAVNSIDANLVSVAGGAVQVDGNGLQVVNVGAYSTGQDPATLVLVTPAQKIATNASNQVVASSVQGSVTGSVASVTGAVNSVATAVDANIVSVAGVAADFDGTPKAVTSSTITLSDADPRAPFVQPGTPFTIPAGTGSGQTVYTLTSRVTGNQWNVTPAWAGGTPDTSASRYNYGVDLGSVAAVGGATLGDHVGVNFNTLFQDGGAATTKTLETLGGAGGPDPWATALPGSYGAGTAGNIVGNNLDARVSTRSTYAGGAVASVTAPVTVGANNDKAGYALSAAGLDAIATTAAVGAGATFPQRLMALFKRFFPVGSGRVVKDSAAGTIKTYADDGTTVLATQTIASTTSTDTLGAAS